MLPAPVTLKPVSSPNLKLHLAVAIDQLGVGAVGRDEAGAVGRAVRAMRTSECRSRSLCGSKPRSARILANISPDCGQFSSAGVKIGWFLARARRNLCSAGRLTPRNNSARTPDDVRTEPSTNSIRLRGRPVRASSTRTEVSKMTSSLIER